MKKITFDITTQSNKNVIYLDFLKNFKKHFEEYTKNANKKNTFLLIINKLYGCKKSNKKELNCDPLKFKIKIFLNFCTTTLFSDAFYFISNTETHRKIGVQNVTEN